MKINSTEDFFKQFILVKYNKNDTILRADDKPKYIYYLETGFVKQYILSAKGSAFITNVYGPKSFFLMHWALNEELNGFYLKAVTPVSVYCAPVEKVKKYFEKNPAELFDFTRRIVKGTIGLLNRVESLLMDPAYKKTVDLLVYLAQKFGKIEGLKVTLKTPFTHKELSSWLGVTRETTSLQMEYLKKKGIISYKSKLIIISDIEKLKQEIQTS